MYKVILLNHKGPAGQRKLSAAGILNNYFLKDDNSLITTYIALKESKPQRNNPDLIKKWLIHQWRESQVNKLYKTEKKAIHEAMVQITKDYAQLHDMKNLLTHDSALLKRIKIITKNKPELLSNDLLYKSGSLNEIQTYLNNNLEFSFSFMQEPPNIPWELIAYLSNRETQIIIFAFSTDLIRKLTSILNAKEYYKSNEFDLFKKIINTLITIYNTLPFYELENTKGHFFVKDYYYYIKYRIHDHLELYKFESETEMLMRKLNDALPRRTPLFFFEDFIHETQEH
ncbi:hypothetical protein ACFL56_03825 [Candidatus Margulisiibacteriota bacterium]